ncbi:hypothetical protein D3C81_994660 [compost metagenome]
MLGEILMSLAAVAQQIGTPVKEHVREVTRIVRMLDRKVQLAVLDHSSNLLDGFPVIRQALLAQLLRHFQRVLAELRERRQPAEPCGHRIDVGRVLFAIAASPWGNLLFVYRSFVPELLCGEIKKRRAVLQPRRTNPVAGKGNLLPAFQRPHLFLADIVSPAAAVYPLRAG